VDVLNRINRTQAPAELLGEAIEMHADLPAEDRRAFEVRSIRIFEMLDRKGFGKKCADLVLAIDYRLTALARLLQEHQVRGWTLPAGDQGADFVHRDLVRAAAEEPVIEDENGYAAFNPESFQARVLRLTTARGQA
jgi:hypothetical protein